MRLRYAQSHRQPRGGSFISRGWMDYAQAALTIANHAETIDRSYGAVRRHNPNWKKIKERTWLVREPANNNETPDTYVIRYFQTNIIKLEPNGFTIEDGGFFSVSTLQRLNELMPSGFHIYGRTLRQTRCLLGFIRTPHGTYPYGYNMSFLYGGKHALLGEQLASRAEETVSALPMYINEYVARLFKKDGRSLSYIETTPPPLPRQQLVAHSILRNHFWSYIAYEALSEIPPMDGCADIDMFDMLKQGGIKAFTAKDAASRMENVLLHGRSLPRMHENRIRRYVKHALYGYIINRLGFKPITWHRR